MAKLNAREVADLLLEIGQRASLQGGNPYKAKAYIRAAEGLRTLVTPLGEVIRRSQLRAIPGIGDAIPAALLSLGTRGPMRDWKGCERGIRQACWSCLRFRG